MQVRSSLAEPDTLFSWGWGEKRVPMEHLCRRVASSDIASLDNWGCEVIELWPPRKNVSEPKEGQAKSLGAGFPSQVDKAKSRTKLGVGVI